MQQRYLHLQFIEGVHKVERWTEVMDSDWHWSGKDSHMRSGRSLRLARAADMSQGKEMGGQQGIADMSQEKEMR